MSKLTTAQYAEQYIKRFGWHLVPIEPGRKFPLSPNWGNNCITSVEQAAEFYSRNPDWNLGLSLSPSRMCSLDIDCAGSWATICEEYGIPSEALDEYPTIQGKGKRVMFSVPDGIDLPYCKLNWPEKDDPKRHYTVVELRASADGKQRQDVLPPSIHPDTKEPYKWIVPIGQHKKLPDPPAWLLSMWQAWDSFKPQLQSCCPWSPKPEPKQPKQQRHDSAPTDVIGRFNEAHDLETMLKLYGYVAKGRRWLSPHSRTGLPGVIPFGDGRCWIHHASDPLCSEDKGQPVAPFDLFCYYEHGGDANKAVKAACGIMGIERQRREPAPMPPSPAPTEQPEPEPEQEGRSTAEFKVLGYNGNSIYVLPRRSEQVVKLSAGSLSKPALLQIASLEWWEHTHPKKGGVEWDQAINTLLRQAENKGIYDTRLERGRGAWYDSGQPVLHLGDSLIVSGEQKAISDHHSRFIYTKQARMENIFGAEPATDEQSCQLVEIFQQLHWSRKEHVLMAMGWCILAPVCGALAWRPHVWLTAQRGAGKSWVQSSIIKPVVGEQTLIYCQGGTTEAGIRQTLQHDARPVMFDEAESEDMAAARRMQSVIELARQASSDTGAEIVKGTATGSGMSFNIRSMFLMGSINVSLRQAADESRFSVVSLARPPRNTGEAERFRQFERMVLSTLTPSFCASIRARTYHAIPAIRKNAQAFAQAVAELMGSQRMGDQIGTLLAGAFSLTTAKNLSVEKCRELISEMDFAEAAEVEDVSDEKNCLNEILQRQVRVEFEQHGATNRSIGELIEIVLSKAWQGGITIYQAEEVLNRHGLKTEGGCLLVANTHAELAKTLSSTAWAAGHRRILLRLEGAKAGDSPIKFAGSLSRYISIPLASIGFN